MKLGIIGLGIKGSVGFDLSTRLYRRIDIERLYINDGKSQQKKEKVKEHCRTHLPYVESGPATLEEMADEADMTILSFERRAGTSKKIKTSSVRSRSELFEGNIDDTIEIARLFGKRKYKGRVIIVTNPTDLLTYFFTKEMKRHTEVGECQVMGFNHIDTWRAERELPRFFGLSDSKEIKNIKAEVWGEHGPNSMIIPSQIRAYSDEVRRVIDFPELTDQLKIKKEKIDRLPRKIAKLFNSTTEEVVQSLEYVLLQMQRGYGRIVMSVPYKQGCIGVPMMIEGEDLKIVKEDIGNLHPKRAIVDGYRVSEKERFENIIKRNYAKIRSIEETGRYIERNESCETSPVDEYLKEERRETSKGRAARGCIITPTKYHGRESKGYGREKDSLKDLPLFRKAVRAGIILAMCSGAAWAGYNVPAWSRDNQAEEQNREQQERTTTSTSDYTSSYLSRNTNTSPQTP